MPKKITELGPGDSLGVGLSATHIHLLNDNNFKIFCDLKTKTNLEVEKSELAKRFKKLTDNDLTTQTVFIQAKK